ncbi:hypothetical protein BuS5_01158 [Desulfosarcina sp. BuS5]|uniref:hypothetical protein n=1 Tax=Desulfosarcina sp. BuS5 TaxID=933262 RepID=UPI0004880089|nr:hypothetical protein [Desulfosarcina sp. BuS5]WDN88190.1 hypothetical protein BuS5_01158 [Desulfosarcina sp. BuS5]
MATKPAFKFFIDHINNPVSPQDEIWETCLPVNRNSPVKQIKTENNRAITYGDYFNAACRFLKDDSSAALLSAISRRLDMDIDSKEINDISIYLVKHGAFYHPGRVEICIKNKKLQFVLTVALSTFGRTTLLKEYNILQKLDNNFPFSFLSAAYKYGEVSLPKTVQKKTGQKESGRKAGLLLGEWLDGFNEFHITTDPDNQKKRIIVWDSVNGNYYLSTGETLELYTQAAMILTCYYNIETFEQIFPWHHAAGDFVVRKKDGGIDLKLITARQYESMVGSSADSNLQETDTNSILEGLLIFFLNLSIRMRLDRIDGVGDTAWADDVAVAGTFKGFMNGLFMKGLAIKSENNIFPGVLDKYFNNLLLSCNKRDLLDLMINIVASYDTRSSEISIIKQNLTQHTEVLHHVINNAQLE